MSDLVDVALLAYRNGKYRDAVELLLQATDINPNDWTARLYLGMAYHKVGRVADAHRLFKRLANDCPDTHVREKAKDALPRVENDLLEKFPKNKPEEKKGFDDWFWSANS